MLRLRGVGWLVLATAAVAANCGQDSDGPSGPKLAITGIVTESDGRPIAGASVSAVCGSRGALQTTDADGRFALTLSNVTPCGTVEFHATASLHVFKVQRIVVDGSTMAVAITLERNPDVGASGGDTIRSTLATTDPPRYVGEAYDSDYLFNATGFNYDTSAGAIVIEMTYAPTGNAKLTMYATAGTRTSASTAPRQSIVLPAGVKDTLLVGQALDGGRLAQDVAFVLTSRPATPQEELPQANLEITSFVPGPYDPPYTFHPALTVRETGGVADAVIRSIEFYSAPDAPRTTFTPEDCFPNPTVRAGQTWTMESPSASCHTFASNVLPGTLSVTVHFADAMGRSGAVSASASTGSASGGR